MTTTIEISTGIGFTTGDSYFIATLHTDRKPKSNGGLTKGNRGGSVVDNTLPDLLRNLADLIEQHQKHFNEDPFEVMGRVLREAQEKE